MKTWNFGIVGAGLIADFHARALGDMPNAKLIGVCGKGPERARSLAAKYRVETFRDYEQMVASSSVAVGTGLSVGYVIWLTRGGLLLASLVTSMPSWRVIDPLPVLSSLLDTKEDLDGDDESLDEMLRKRANADTSYSDDALES